MVLLLIQNSDRLVTCVGLLVELEGEVKTSLS